MGAVLFHWLLKMVDYVFAIVEKTKQTKKQASKQANKMKAWCGTVYPKYGMAIVLLDS